MKITLFKGDVVRDRFLYNMCFEEHHKEVPLNGIPLDLSIDYDYYIAMERSNRLYAIGAQNAFGDLLGYLVATVHGHPHYKSTRFASTEAFWVSPKVRAHSGLKIIRQLMDKTEKELKILYNIDIITVRVNPIKDISKIFTRMGYNETCIYLSKKL
jgi:hypothetical protein